MGNEQIDVNVETSTDNSEVTTEQILEALEPEQDVEPQDDKVDVEKEETQPSETKEEQPDNTEEVPEKFISADGKADINKILKSYKELEGYKSKLEKERADLLKIKEQADKEAQAKEQQARNAGYESVLDMQQKYEIAQIEANEYAKYLSVTDDPQEVLKMLQAYASNPSPELMKEIELEFAPEINKQIAIISDRKARDFEILKAQQAETQKYSNIETVISKSIEKNNDLFNYEPFKQLVIRTLARYGDNFTYEDSEILMDTMVQMKELFQKEFENNKNAQIQNNSATDKLSSISGQNSAPSASTPTDISKLSDKELAKVIRQFI